MAFSNALSLCLLFGAASVVGLRSGRTSASAVEKRLDRGAMPGEAIKRVVDMLTNLIAEMDAEQAKDEKEFAAFQEWCGTQQAATQQSIDMLTNKIEELTASLANLYSQKMELETAIRKLDGEIAETRTAIQQATQKRNEENAAFNSEQTDFDNSIRACNKAVDILSQHYGDGTVKEAKKPDFMSLVQATETVRAAVKRHGKTVQPLLQNFLQQTIPSSDRYQAKTGEALNIVDQMKVLADTFAEDKQSAIDEEGRLQGMYDKLMQEKTDLLNSLVSERNQQQSVLNAVNQDIAEKETAKANAEAELKDEQAYLAAVKKSCSDTAVLFEQRQKDRAAEKLATGEAIKVLEGSAGEAFTQTGIQTRARSKQRVVQRVKQQCPTCTKAAALLSQASKMLHSSLLASAAAATLGSDALQDVIVELNKMIANIDADQKLETEHKEWCETELSKTQAKKANHEGIVAELTQKIADEKETIVEKKQGIQDTIDSIARADKNFQEATELRAEQKAAFEEELQNYNDALSALNQAIDILSKFYASKKKSFLEGGVAPRAIAPGVFDSAYKQKGGAGVIEMIATVRGEYEQGKADLEKAEAQAVADYATTKADYQQTRRDLVSQKDRLTTELQTAESNLDQFEDDKQSNEDEIQAAVTYLGQLAHSCDSLLENYDKRVQLRIEEKTAIKKAIDVLENEA